jgi:hypothetical protein
MLKNVTNIHINKKNLYVCVGSDFIKKLNKNIENLNFGSKSNGPLHYRVKFKVLKAVV